MGVKPNTKATLGRIRLEEAHPAEAERLLRDAVSGYEKTGANSWQRYHAVCMLGESVAEQGRMAEASGLLNAGYAGLMQRQSSISADAGAIVEQAREWAARVSGGIICRLLWDGREIPLQPGENVLGREPEAAVWIDDSAVSRRHARIVVGGDMATLEDLGSKNGTKLQGKKIRTVAPLADRDAIRIGPASLVFRLYRQTGSTETAVENETPA